MIAATARTVPKTNASLAGSGFGAMCALLAPDKCCHGALWRGELEETYEPLHISLGHNRAPGQGQPDEPAVIGRHRPPTCGHLRKAQLACDDMQEVPDLQWEVQINVGGYPVVTALLSRCDL